MKKKNSSLLLCFTVLSLLLVEHLRRLILRAKESLCYCVTVSTYGWHWSVAGIEANKLSE